MKNNLLTTEDLAERWKIKTITLALWRQKGLSPKYFKIGRRVMFRIQDIEDFEEQKLRHNSLPKFKIVEV